MNHASSETSQPDAALASSVSNAPVPQLQACLAQTTPIVLECPKEPDQGAQGIIGEVLGMGWPFAIVLLMLMLVAFDRRGRTGAFLEALTGFVDRLRRVVIGGTEITTDMEEALQRNPAVGVDPLGKPGKQGKSSDDDLVRKLIAKDFSNVILGDYPYLMHEGKKTPKGRFPFAARVYLEFWTSNEQRFQKEDVEKVFYRVDDTFPEGWWVMSSMEAKTDFQLVVRIIGEFTIVAVVKLKSGDYIWLTRYLDLPGRPVD